MVQWLSLCASKAGHTHSIPNWGTKILQAVRLSPKKKKKKVSSLSQHGLPLHFGLLCWQTLIVPLKTSSDQLSPAQTPSFGSTVRGLVLRQHPQPLQPLTVSFLQVEGRGCVLGGLFVLVLFSWPVQALSRCSVNPFK